MKTEEGKTIKDYLHLYIGCDVQFIYETRSDIPALRHEMRVGRVLRVGQNGMATDVEIISPNGSYYRCVCENIKPILRPLSNMTKDEKILCDIHSSAPYEPEEFIYLLKQGYDLFGLIESGLAIDKTKSNSNQ